MTYVYSAHKCGPCTELVADESYDSGSVTIVRDLGIPKTTAVPQFFVVMRYCLNEEISTAEKLADPTEVSMGKKWAVYCGNSPLRPWTRKLQTDSLAEAKTKYEEVKLTTRHTILVCTEMERVPLKVSDALNTFKCDFGGTKPLMYRGPNHVSAYSSG